MNEGLTGELEWLNGRPLYASLSGGKDSTALGLWLKSQGIRFTPVFCDTGWEHPATYEYIKAVLEPLFGAFTVVRNEKLFQDDPEWAGGMEQGIRKFKMFSSGRHRWCSYYLKVLPAQNLLAEVQYTSGRKPVSAVGIRGAESASRAKMTATEEQDEATVWRPLLNWSEAEVIELHARYNVRPNPLYLGGASRVGCYPCIFARKNEIRHLAATAPERVEHIAQLEERVTELRQATTPGAAEATFFRSKRPDVPKMNIRQVVEWSRTKDGEVIDDLAEQEEQGCMRWGLCETPMAKETDE